MWHSLPVPHPSEAAAGLGSSSSTLLRFNQQGVGLTRRREEKYLERFSCELSKPSLTNGKQTGKVTKLKITRIF